MSDDYHKSLYLVQSQGGKLRQICVPQAWQERVRQAVSDYQNTETDRRGFGTGVETT